MKKAELKMLEAIEEDLNTRFANVDRKQVKTWSSRNIPKTGRRRPVVQDGKRYI